MTETRWTPAEQLNLPDDLRAWLDDRSLLHLAFEALHAVEFDSRTHQALLPKGVPRTLLTLLTYSYAVGYFASEEIERRLETDRQLGYLAARTGVTSQEL